MRTIAHISDLHFGRIDPAITESFLRDLRLCRPDLVVVSGDITQRARRRQFEAARALFDSISVPLLIIPGNHDIPLYNLGRRFLSPLGRYRRYISEELNPSYLDNEIAVFGINTARPFTWMMGRISPSQVADVCRKVKDLPARVFRVVVTHHPFILPPTERFPALVGRSRKTLEAFEACGIELLLSGHFHVGFMEDARTFHGTIKHGMLIAQAATFSKRSRGDPNSYNLVRIERPELSITVRVWEKGRFHSRRETRWKRSRREWVKQNILGVRL